LGIPVLIGFDVALRQPATNFPASLSSASAEARWLRPEAIAPARFVINPKTEQGS